MNWWRIQIDENGSILSCDSVESKGTNKRRVLYLEASSAKEAVEKAKRWYKTWRTEYAKKYRKAALDKAKALGLCHYVNCACTPVQSFKFCQTHLDQRRRLDRRYRDGEATPRMPMDLIQAYNKNKEASARSSATYRKRHGRSEYRLLVKVLEHHKTLTPQKFVAWLTAQITKLAPVDSTVSAEKRDGES